MERCRGRPATAWGELCALVFVLAFGGCSQGTEAPSTARVPVPECEAYAARIALCFHRDDARIGIETVAPSQTERERLARSCIASLERLNDACR
jgi:hypothetical protein